MSLFTSTHFASAAASGTDWRDTSKNVLEKLESVRTSKDSFNLGFLYISDHIADDATSILNLFHSVLGVENWVGSIGMGVIGMGEAFIDQPAIAAMVGKFSADSFCVFPQTDEFHSSGDEDPQAKVKNWLRNVQPMLTLVHVDPMAKQDPNEVIAQMERSSSLFVVGGMTSSRAQHYQIANAVCDNTVSGVFFAQDLQVSSMLSQGCTPIAGTHTITRADDNTILEIDGRRAMEALQDDLKAYAASLSGKPVESYTHDLYRLSNAEHAPEEFLPLFQGNIHCALSDAHSDGRDFMVRNIAGMNTDDRSISLAQTIVSGERISFVIRTHETITADLSRNLVNLRERVTAERGQFDPKGGLYISCIARGFTEHPNLNYEMDLLRDIIGDLPLAGFYAGGEISNARLYGYTGVLILFF